MNKHWLDILLLDVGMTQADLSRAAEVDSGTLSNIRNGKRRMGVTIAKRIAKATRRKTEEILRLAGEIDGSAPNDPRLERIDSLYNSLQLDDNKQRALEFLKFLTDLEDKNDSAGKKPK